MKKLPLFLVFFSSSVYADPGWYSLSLSKVNFNGYAWQHERIWNEGNIYTREWLAGTQQSSCQSAIEKAQVALDQNYESFLNNSNVSSDVSIERTISDCFPYPEADPEPGDLAYSRVHISLKAYSCTGPAGPFVNQSECEEDDPENDTPSLNMCLSKEPINGSLGPVYFNDSLNQWEANHDGCSWSTSYSNVSVITINDFGVATVSSTWTPYDLADLRPPGTAVSCLNNPDLLLGQCSEDEEPEDPSEDDEIGGDTTNPSDPDDSTDSGQSTPVDDGTSGSGSDITTPPFESDSTDVISAINASGRSLHESLASLAERTSAVGDGIERRINSQTRDITNAVDSSASNIRSSIDDQTNSFGAAISDQTSTLDGSLDALGVSIVDAINDLGTGLGDQPSNGEGDGGLLDGISGLLDGLVEKLASRFTEDLGNSENLFDSSNMDETLDEVASLEQEHTDDVNSLMDEIGNGATSSIADQVTSRLPSLPSGGCTPIEFGPIEISCQPFNLIKSWLTWIIYFWTVVSIVDTFFRSGQRTA